MGLETLVVGSDWRDFGSMKGNLQSLLDFTQYIGLQFEKRSTCVIMNGNLVDSRVLCGHMLERSKKEVDGVFLENIKKNYSNNTEHL